VKRRRYYAVDAFGTRRRVGFLRSLWLRIIGA
jgi:hypothetical protein